MIESRHALRVPGLTPQDFFEQGNAYSKLLNDLISVLKTLDEDALGNLLGIARRMGKG